MKKKVIKSKSPTPVPVSQPLVETPRFKEKAIHLSQLPQSPKIQVDSEYFSFGGLNQVQQQSPIKKQSKSVYEGPEKNKQLNNSFDKKVVMKTEKVQIQIININQIDKKDSFRALQKQFQQILDTQTKKQAGTPTKKLVSPSNVSQSKTPTITTATNYFNGQRFKKPIITPKKKV